MKRWTGSAVTERIERLFLAVFGLLLIFMTGICLAKPQHNLIPSRMVIFTLVWIVALYFGRFILVCFGKWTERNEKKKLIKIMLVLFFIIWACLLYIVGCTARSSPHTDFENVYQAADALARGLEVDNWEYFSRCTNNRFPMLFLSGLLHLGYVVGMQDAYYFVLAFQVLHIVITAICLYYLAGIGSPAKAFANSWTVLMLMFLFTPVWGNIAFFYTDQLSFGYSIIAYTLIYIAIHNNHKKCLKYFLIIAGGIVWGIVFQIKVTSAIPLLAVGIVVVLRRRYRNAVKLLAVFCAAFALVLAAGNIRVRLLPCEENVERDSDPILYWVALGLNGDGSYAANQDFAIQCTLADNKTEREYIVKEKIKDDWRNFFDVEHLVAKVRCNFACGDVGASGYMTYPYREENFVHELMSWDGQYFWKYACLSTSYLFALFLLIAVGALRGAYHGKVEFTAMSSYVAVFGIMLFLMLWEAQNKQLFNQTGWLLLAAGYGLQMIGNSDKYCCKNKKTKTDK